MQRNEQRPRPIAPGGDAYGTHRVIDPPGGTPQPAWRLDNDFGRLFDGELLIAAETLNIDAASFAQIGQQGGSDEEIAHIILRTVRERGKQHNPVTGSGGMLLGHVVQIAPGRGEPTGELHEGDRVATLVSLTLTPLRVDRIHAVRRAGAQVDIEGEAILFASGSYAKLPDDLPERLALAALDVAGAAPQVTRLVKKDDIVLILGAGGKSGVLCAAEARLRGGTGALVLGVEPNVLSANELRALDLCDAVVQVDGRDPIAVRRSVLEATRGREADVTFSCMNVPDGEAAAILSTRDRGIVCFFAMSTSFTKAALGAEGFGKDVDLFIGNGFARGHAEHTLAMLRDMPKIRGLFERRYT